MNPIPQCVPSFDENEARALYDYVATGGWMTEFNKTREFEDRLAAFTGARHCVAANNGTVTLVMALLAAGVGPGDEVIVPDFTMIATPNAARLIGARPVLVDIEPDTLCLDIARTRAAITPRTKAVMHVSLNGRCNDLDALSALCKARGITLIEDAAQSLGSFWRGRHLGSIGDLGSLSFSPAKIVSTGQGGLVMTSDDALAVAVRRLKDFGRLKGGADIHDCLGYNFKFTDLQAVVGLVQLTKLPARMERKKAIFERYRTDLGGIAAIEFVPTDLAATTPWFADIYVPDRDALARHLAGQKIETRPVYPAIHSQAIYKGTQGDFPVADRYCARGLWLPSSPTLTDEELSRVCEAIRGFYVEREGTRA